MTVKRLAYIDPKTGVLAIVVQVDPNVDPARDVPAGVPFVEVKDVPGDRIFRDAWTLVEGRVTVDLAKARSVLLAKIRQARGPALAELDREWMRAMGQKRQKDADDVEAKRQALRDLPATVGLERLGTPEELAAFWPEELKGHRG